MRRTPWPMPYKSGSCLFQCSHVRQCTHQKECSGPIIEARTGVKDLICTLPSTKSSARYPYVFDKATESNTDMFPAANSTLCSASKIANCAVLVFAESSPGGTSAIGPIPEMRFETSMPLNCKGLIAVSTASGRIGTLIFMINPMSSASC